MNSAEEEFRMGRLVEVDERAVRRLVCGRIGPTGWRTFSLNSGKIPKSTSRSAIRSRLHYDKRDAEHANRADELESEGGRPNSEMEAILVAACKAQQRKDGIAGLTFKLELPAEFDATMRQEVMLTIERFFEMQGHPVHWAVHSHNERGEYQPHGHFTVSKRPVRLIGGRWVGEGGGNKHRGPGAKAILDGEGECQAFRRLIADSVNRIANARGLDLAPRWHPGSFKDIGVDRPPLPRLPMAVYKGKLEPKPDGPLLARQLIQEGRYDELRVMRRGWSRKDHSARMERQMAAAEQAAIVEQRDRDVIRSGKGTVRATSARAAVVHGLDAPHPATKKQARLILIMAQEARISLPDLWRQCDAGELIRDLRAAKRDSTKRQELQARLDAPRTHARDVVEWAATTIDREHQPWPDAPSIRAGMDWSVTPTLHVAMDWPIHRGRDHVQELQAWGIPSDGREAREWQGDRTRRDALDVVAWLDFTPNTEERNDELGRSDARLRQSIELAAGRHRRTDAGNTRSADAETNGRPVEAGSHLAEGFSNRGSSGNCLAESSGHPGGAQNLFAASMIALDLHLARIRELEKERDDADAARNRAEERRIAAEATVEHVQATVRADHHLGATKNDGGEKRFIVENLGPYGYAIWAGEPLAGDQPIHLGVLHGAPKQWIEEARLGRPAAPHEIVEYNMAESKRRRACRRAAEERAHTAAVDARRLDEVEIDRRATERLTTVKHAETPPDPPPTVASTDFIAGLDKLTQSALASRNVAYQTLWTLIEVYRAVGLPEPSSLTRQYVRIRRSKELGQ